MVQSGFSFPRQWQDWLSWLLGIWLLLSPWTFGFDSEGTAMRNAVVLGALIILVEVVELSIFRGWEEWINVALGGWLLVSPWALSVASAAAKWNFVVVGALVLALAAYELWDVRQNPRPDAG